MVAKIRTTDTPLAKELFDEPYRFEFFQAVRLLERIFPDRHPVGGYWLPKDEVVRFRTVASMNFPPSEITDLRGKPEDKTDGSVNEPQIKQAEMEIAFMGLTGPSGLLPYHYTNRIMDLRREKDTILWEFLDLFNHRMVSLFYRAWEKYRVTVEYERTAASKGQESRFTEHLFDLIGLGTKGLRGRMALNDQSLLSYAGLISQRPHSAAAIRAIVSDYFQVPAEVRQFTGRWLRLGISSLSKMGMANCSLGINTIAGERVWDSQSKFRIRLGPMSLVKFQSFLPIGKAYKPAVDLIKLLAGAERDFSLQLTLRARQVPGCVLTTRAKRKPRLGWSSWLKTKPFTKDDSQVVLESVSG